MVTMTTKRGKQIKLLPVGEWYEYMCGKYGDANKRYFDGLSALEQAMLQSEHYKVCVECLTQDNLEHITTRALIKSTDYYMCKECLEYYAKK